MKVVLVSHTHWDREWYRTFQGFRARLADVVDDVLERLRDDPGFRFLLDGQAVVLEDYLEVRPTKRGALEAACREGRVAVGPWYVQPDSLLPSGEAHVRNLLEGRRVTSGFGPPTAVAYTPDSFGHPAQLPQILAGFGLSAFVYWRGNGEELDRLPAEYRWIAPDASEVVACHLGRGYFGAALLPLEVGAAVERLRDLGKALAERTEQGRVLFMNGIDHAAVDPHTDEVARALAEATGWEVQRGLLEDFTRALVRPAAAHRGELLGGRAANLLPGVWSARTPVKLRNRRCEALLEGETEPWAALGALVGLPDERPSLRLAWRALLRNQAHDSLCGCSVDLVHTQMQARFDEAEELGAETARRVLERLAGQGVTRQTAPGPAADVAVFNPSPHPRSDVVRIALDPFPPFQGEQTGVRYQELLAACRAGRGFCVDGRPARVVPADPTGRFLLTPEQTPLDLEVLVEDVPAFGWRRVRVAAEGERAEDAVDAEASIGDGALGVRALADGTLELRAGSRTWSGLLAVEDVGDRGDSYDFDPVEGPPAETVGVAVERRRAGPLEILRVERSVRVPAGLAPDRERRSEETVELPLVTEARIARGVRRVDLRVRLENRARDHRLRLLFPGHGRVRAATTFDEVERDGAPAMASGWLHPAPGTFPHQGWLVTDDLLVAAPGLPEAAVLADGRLALTLVRAVGWLARTGLRTRPVPAGPALEVPGAQCSGAIEAWLALVPDGDARDARDAEVRFRAVFAGPTPLVATDVPVLSLEPRPLRLSAFKPAEQGPGAVLRILNPTDRPLEARVRLGVTVSRAEMVRLDETPAAESCALVGRELRIAVPPKALRSVRLEP